MKRMRALLGTYVEIAAAGCAEPRLAGAIDLAFASVGLVHRLMSVHSADSDLSRINRDAWRHPVEVHPWTARTLRWALCLYHATSGLFDCAVGHDLHKRKLRDGCGLAETERGSLADLELTGDGRVRLARRIGLDLGGIAKGFAVDRAIATLRWAGVRTAIVNAGGDLRVMGPEPQPIHLRDPAGGGTARLVGYLTNGAIATSGTSELVRVRDCGPTVDGHSYTIVAPICVLADGLTKAIAQDGRIDAPWLAKFGATALVTTPCALPV
jgi:FAD:protein FMN transferase